MVSLSINVEGLDTTSRALDRPTAITDVDYYEVVFKHGTSYYQTAWLASAAQSASITIPTGTYTGATDAVLFGGRQSDKTLLAVGIIYSVTDAGPPVVGATINSTSTSVTFIMTALTSAVTNNPATSAFLITGPTSDAVNGWNYSTAASDSTPAIETLTGGGPAYPVFPVPGNAYANAGTGTQGDIANTADNIVGAYTINIPNNTAVILQAPWVATPAPYTGLTTDSPTTGTVDCIELIKPANTALSATCVFTFLVDVSGATDGLTAVSIAAPVRAISSTATTFVTGAPITWYVRGGRVNATPSGATTPEGGAVILAVGKYDANFPVTPSTAGITVNTPGGGNWNP